MSWLSPTTGTLLASVRIVVSSPSTFFKILTIRTHVVFIKVAMDTIAMVPLRSGLAVFFLRKKRQFSQLLARVSAFLLMFVAIVSGRTMTFLFFANDRDDLAQSNILAD